jgi:hypothetical protein
VIIPSSPRQQPLSQSCPPCAVVAVSVADGKRTYVCTYCSPDIHTDIHTYTHSLVPAVMIPHRIHRPVIRFDDVLLPRGTGWPGCTQKSMAHMIPPPNCREQVWNSIPETRLKCRNGCGSSSCWGCVCLCGCGLCPRTGDHHE